MIALRSVLAVMKKEFLDSIRNKWILAVTAIYTILTLVTSYFGAASAGGATGFQGFRETAVGMNTTAALLVPILSLMLGYAAIAGEREQGSLGLLLSMPLTRLELLLGKFLGLTLVVGTAIVAGFGFAGVLIAASAGTAYWDAYLGMLFATVLLGGAFLALSILFSSLLQRRSSALAVAVLLWFFFSIIYSVILVGVYVATGGQIRVGPGGPSAIEFPGWYWGAQVFNPALAYRLYFVGAFNVSGLELGAIPGFVNPWTIDLSLLAWIVVPILLAYLFLRRADL